jgi:hypothetical protein
LQRTTYARVILDFLSGGHSSRAWQDRNAMSAPVVFLRQGKQNDSLTVADEDTRDLVVAVADTRRALMVVSTRLPRALSRISLSLAVAVVGISLAKRLAKE